VVAGSGFEPLTLQVMRLTSYGVLHPALGSASPAFTASSPSATCALSLGGSAYVAAATAMRATSFSNTIDGNRESLVMAWATFRECCDCLKLTALMVEAAQPNRTRMLELTEQNFSTATDLADAMVRDCGLSFRDAHHVVGAAVRMAMDQGLAANVITSAMVDLAARDVIGRPLGVPAATVASCLDPIQAVVARRTVGGPSPNEVRRRATAIRNNLAAMRAVQSERYDRLSAAEQRLQAAARSLI
jgi:argininosuccinate lyase